MRKKSRKKSQREAEAEDWNRPISVNSQSGGQNNKIFLHLKGLFPLRGQNNIVLSSRYWELLKWVYERINYRQGIFHRPPPNLVILMASLTVSVPASRYVLLLFSCLYKRMEGRVVQCLARALDLHVVAPGSNLVLTSDLDLFPVITDSTLPRFVIPIWLPLLIVFPLSLNCFCQLMRSGVPVNYNRLQNSFGRLFAVCAIIGKLITP